MQNAVAKIETGQPTVEWAQRISERWRQSIDAVIDAGRLLIEAKAALPHGQFQKMVNNHLPFTADTAAKLMAICRDERVLANRDTLPQAWSTLYEVTKLSDAEFKRCQRAKLLRPDTERWEIEGFRRTGAVTVAPREIPWMPTFGSPDPRRWTVAQLKINAKRLQALVDHAGAASSTSAVGEVVSDRAIRKIWKD